MRSAIFRRRVQRTSLTLNHTLIWICRKETQLSTLRIYSWLSRLLCLTCITGLLLPAMAGGKKQEADVQRINDRGRIDWGSGTLYATGLGAVSRTETNDAKAYLKARSFAKLDALRNLLMVIDHVRIDSHTVGADFETQSDTIRAEVQGIVKGAEVFGERDIRKGRDTMIEVTVATHMYGDQGIAHAFIPEEMKRREEAPAPGTPPSEYHVRPEIEPAPAVPEGAAYTSVIIDTRGYKVDRCMAPKILREDGSEVWGTVQVDPDYVLEHGIVIYAHTMPEARALNRCGRNPLILRASGTARTAIPSDAVINEADAARLLSLNARDGFMNKFNVIFLVDPLH